jgi:hypothetical protein
MCDIAWEQQHITRAKQQARRYGGVVAGKAARCESVGQGGEQGGSGTDGIVRCGAFAGKEGGWGGGGGGGMEVEEEEEEQEDAESSGRVWGHEHGLGRERMIEDNARILRLACTFCRPLNASKHIAAAAAPARLTMAFVFKP